MEGYNDFGKSISQVIYMTSGTSWLTEVTLALSPPPSPQPGLNSSDSLQDLINSSIEVIQYRKTMLAAALESCLFVGS